MITRFQKMDTRIIFVICLVHGTYGQTIDPKPENTHVFVGENATFFCTILDIPTGTIWYKTEDDIDIGISFDDSITLIDGAGKYEIEGTYNLKIIDTVMGDALTYRCEYLSNSASHFKASLIVLESHPVCTTSLLEDNIAIEGETIEYSCTINYAGKWGPTMTWRDNTGDIIQSSDSGVEGSSVIHQIVIPVTPADDTKSFSCETNFGPLDPAPGVKEATNIPEYNYEYESDPIIVHFPPRNTRIEPDEETIHVGETLTCLSDANPAVDTWEWFNLTNPDAGPISTDQTITVDESWVDQTVNLSCKVTNLMRDDTQGEDTVEISFDAYKTTTTTTTPTTTTTTMPPSTTTEDTSGGGGSTGGEGLGTGAVAGIAVVIVICVVILVIIVVVCFVKRKQTKNKDAEASRPPKSAMQSDLVRKPNDAYYNGQAPVSTISGQPPPPYNGDTSYDSGYDPYGTDPRKRNVENIVYADLALDDTPRSRKPIQVYEQTDYAELQRV